VKYVEIDLDALEHNYHEIRRIIGPERKILAIVKADAYGHGSKTIAKELERLGVEFFGVAFLEEGVELRKEGIERPIIILSGICPAKIREVLEYRMTPIIYSLESAQLLIKNLQGCEGKLKVHIKLDTGMGRWGILPEEISLLCNIIEGSKNLEIEGVLTHLSCADLRDEESISFSKKQLSIFQHCLSRIHESGIHPQFIHIANSAAILDGTIELFNLVRPGLTLYGIYPSDSFRGKMHLRPLMSLKTFVCQLKRLPKGFPISYGRTFITKQESLIAVLPIGYADGYLRALSNKATALVNGIKVPAIGSITMDGMMVDVTHAGEVKVGDEVILIGRQGKEEIKVEELARKAGTIPYELLCSIGQRVPRIYKGKGLNFGPYAGGKNAQD